MKIIMTNFRSIPENKPVADYNRFDKLSDFLSEDHEIIYISTYRGVRLLKAAHKNRLVYKIPTFTGGYIGVIILYLFSPFFLKRIVKETNPDLVFINSFFYARCIKIVKPLGILLHIDVMGIEHLEWIRKNGSGFVSSIISQLIKRAESLIYTSADLITTVNLAHKKALSNYTSKPISVLRDGVEMPNAEQLRHKRQRNKNIRLIFVGSVIKNRLDDLFEALKIAMKKVRNLEICIVGDGSELARYKNVSRENKWLNNKIEFTGYAEHSKVYTMISNSDICFSDDWSEIGFPSKVFEYMILSKPIIVENTEAVREIVDDGISGILYKNQDDLSDAIVKLSIDKNLRTNLGHNGYNKIIAEHMWPQRKNDLKRIYSKIVMPLYLSRNIT